MTYFHEYVKTKRIERKVTFRTFCKMVKINPVKWSRIERGLSTPPSNCRILRRISEVLHFSTVETLSMIALALPEYSRLTSEGPKNVSGALPIFVGKRYGGKPSKEELEKVFIMIKLS